MIPLRDNQPTSTFPIVTLLLIAVNILVYVGQQVLPLDQVWSLVPYAITHNVDLNGTFAHIGPGGVAHLIQPPPGAIVRLGPRDIPFGPAPHPVWLTVFTSMFLHGGLLHIGGKRRPAAHRRQHAVLVDFRQQHRGCFGPCPFPRVLSCLRPSGLGGADRD